MDDIAGIVEEKVNEVYDRAVREYVGEHPLEGIEEEIRQIVKQRATSQLMFSLSRLTFPEGTSKKERIDEWYDESIRQEIVTACKKCLEEEVQKRSSGGDDGLSAIDRYLAKHGMGKGAK